MAQGILMEKTAAEEEPWRIASAGVYAQAGYPPAQNTLIILAERGIDLSDQQSRPVTAGLVGQYQLILTMEQGHKEALQAAFPSDASRVYLFSEMGGEYRDIVDPIGKALVDYRDTAQEIDAFLERGFERIRSLSRHSDEPIAS
jgi:protein-tyrosine-phosphatase